MKHKWIFDFSYNTELNEQLAVYHCEYHLEVKKLSATNLDGQKDYEKTN